MPFKYRKGLLKENGNITVNKLCAIIKRRVRIDQIKPEPQYTTALNTLNSSGNPAMAQVIEVNETTEATITTDKHDNIIEAKKIDYTVTMTEVMDKEKTANTNETTEATITTDKHNNIIEAKKIDYRVTTTEVMGKTKTACTSKNVLQNMYKRPEFFQNSTSIPRFKYTI